MLALRAQGKIAVVAAAMHGLRILFRMQRERMGLSRGMFQNHL